MILIVAWIIAVVFGAIALIAGLCNTFLMGVWLWTRNQSPSSVFVVGITAALVCAIALRWVSPNQAVINVFRIVMLLAVFGELGCAALGATARLWERRPVRSEVRE